MFDWLVVRLIAVDGLLKCEKWIRDDDDHSEESKASWWLNRLIGRTKKVSIDWPYPFAEGKLFVLTLSAGLEGYHVTVDGRHITSFPYRTVSNNMHPHNLIVNVHYLALLVYIFSKFNRVLLSKMRLA